MKRRSFEVLSAKRIKGVFHVRLLCRDNTVIHCIGNKGNWRVKGGRFELKKRLINALDDVVDNFPILSSFHLNFSNKKEEK
jgi:hypothetical protein